MLYKTSWKLHARPAGYFCSGIFAPKYPRPSANIVAASRFSYPGNGRPFTPGRREAARIREAGVSAKSGEREALGYAEGTDPRGAPEPVPVHVKLLVEIALVVTNLRVFPGGVLTGILVIPACHHRVLIEALLLVPNSITLLDELVVGLFQLVVLLLGRLQD